MISISMLVCAGKPDPESNGLMNVESVVVRKIHAEFPGQHPLYLALFVSRTPPFGDLEVLTEIVNPDGNVPEASRKTARIPGGWDFATLSINLGHVVFETEGAYRFNLYSREQGQEEWPEEPSCFWLLYALNSRRLSPTGAGRDNMVPQASP